MKIEKMKYDDPRLLIILLEDGDVITTSGGTQGSLGSGDGEETNDGGGWTQKIVLKNSKYERKKQ